MIHQNGCKCSNVPHPVCALTYVQTAGDNRIMHDPEDQGELKILCESPGPADDLMTCMWRKGGSSREIMKGWILNKMKRTFLRCPLLLYTKGNNWSAACQSILYYFVFRATIDHNQKSSFECLSNEEMYFHLLSAIIHYNSSQNEFINICSMLEHTTTREDELLYSTKHIISIFGETSPHCPGCYSPWICCWRKMAHHQIKLQQSPQVTIYKENILMST